MHVGSARTLRRSEILSEERREASVFHTREFLELFRDAKNVRASSFTLAEGTMPVGGFNAFTIRSVAGAPARIQSRSTIFAPAWLCNRSDEREFYREALPQFAACMKNECLFAEWRMAQNAEELADVFAAHGWEYVAYLNYVVPLDRDVEKIWMSFDTNTRNSIRRAKAKGLTTRCIQPGEDEKSYEMIRALYDNKGIPLFDKSVFMNAFRTLVPLGMLRATFAVVDGNIAATRLALLHNGVVFDWYAASNREFAKLNPNETLAWEMMEYGATQGYRVFDFGGAGKKGEEYGPRKFKEKFRGELVEQGRFIKPFRPRVYQLMQYLYERRMAKTRPRPDMSGYVEKGAQSKL
jgi:hypothetical protein